MTRGVLQRFHEVPVPGPPRGESRAELELVIARYAEDVSWSSAQSENRTLYNKGGATVHEHVRLPNVGREGHTYLHHIVENYDRLADVTIFSQGSRPTWGRFYGHLFSGVDLAAYAALERPLRLFVTERADPDFRRLQVRNGYYDGPIGLAAPSPFPSGVDGDCQGRLYPGFRDFGVWFDDEVLGRRRAAQRDVLPSMMFLEFFDEYVGKPRPEQFVYFAQGAIFAATRECIRRNPRSYYERLRGLLAAHRDPTLATSSSTAGSTCSTVPSGSSGRWR